MITQAKFKAGLRVLQTHFNKTLSEDAISIWREYLDEHLDDEGFTTAVKEAVISCEFMPTPKKLVEFASGSLQTKAMEEWRVTVLRWAASSVENQEKIWPSLSLRCRAAVQLIGGFHAVGIAEYGELRQLEQQFIAAYCQCAPNAKTLPPAKIPPTTFEAEERPQGSFDLNNKPEPLKLVFKTLEDRIKGERLSDQQAALNMFVLKWKWQIDLGRLEHYLVMSQPERITFLGRFGYAMRHSPEWKSAVTHFDCLTNYTPPKTEVNSKAIAREWLQN